MKKTLLFIGVFFLVTIARAQPVPGRVDSLRKAIANADSSRYERLFTSLSDQTALLTPEQDLAEAEQAIKIVEQLNKPVALVYAYRNLGNAYMHAKKNGEALIAFQKAYDLAVENKKKHETGVMALRLGNFYFGEQFLTEALEKLYEADRIFLSLNDTENLFKANCGTSQINYRTRHYGESISEAKEANRYFEKLKRPLHEDSVDIMSSHNTVGLAAFRLNDFELSLSAFQRAEQLAKMLKDEFWVGLINGNRAKIYRAQGFTQMAINNLKQDFAISRKFKEWSSAASSAITLADIYLDGKNTEFAKKYLDTAASLLPKVTATRVKLNEARTRARFYETVGDLSNSLKAQKEVTRFNDSLVVESERINLGRFRARYELEKKQSEIVSLKHANDIQLKEIENQRIVIWSTGIILALVVLLILVIIRDSNRLKAQYSLISAQRAEIENKNDELEAQSQTLQQQNEIIGSINLKLEEKVRVRTEELDVANKELDRFLYHASHDIRRPIATLLGLEQVFQLSGRETWQMLFEKVSDTAHSMDSMLFKLHMAYELNRPTGERSEVSLHASIDDTAKIFDSDFQRRNIDYIHVRGIPINFLSNKELLQVILRNIIENAISFRRPHVEERPFVRIHSSVKEGRVAIEVEDNGIGIDPKYAGRIFDLYFRGTQQSKGNGVGLYLAKKAAAMLGGTIEMQSEWGTGSVFTVHLPLIN